MFVEYLMELLELTSLHGAHVGLPGVNGLSSEQRNSGDGDPGCGADFGAPAAGSSPQVHRT